MSAKKIPVWSWRQAVAKTNVPTLTKALCWGIANYLSDAGKGAWPSLDTLIADTGMSERSITGHLRKAEKAGLLVTHRKRLENGTLGARTFHPRFPKHTVLASEVSGDAGGIEIPPAPNAGSPPARRAEPPAPSAGQENISRARAPRTQRGRRPKEPLAPDRTPEEHEEHADAFAADMMETIRPEGDPDDCRRFFRNMYASEFGVTLAEPEEDFMETAGKAERLLAQIQDACMAATRAGEIERANYLMALADALDLQIGEAAAKLPKRKRVPA